MGVSLFVGWDIGYWDIVIWDRGERGEDIYELVLLVVSPILFKRSVVIEVKWLNSSDGDISEQRD